jgi:hypothetical protein
MFMKRSSLLIIPLITCVTLVACDSCTSTQSQTATLPFTSSATTSTGTDTYHGDLLGITFDYPCGWYLQDVPEEPFDVLLTSYNPASPPHKLEWNEDTVSIGIRLLPVELSSDSLEVWVKNLKLEATAAHLNIFAEERLTLMNGLQAAHITVVSGSGGIIEYVLVILNGDNYEIVIEGNFALAKTVIDTLQPMTSD